MPQVFITFIALIIFSFFSGCTNGAFAQDTATAAAGQKTQELIAALSKTKHKKKEKKGVSLELYVDVKSEAVVKNNVRAYAGLYQSPDAEYRLELRVSTDGGRIEGSGYDTNWTNSERQNFTLRNARIEGALLTATKVYTNGKTENFEAVFNNRTVVQGKNPNEINSRETKYGLGFVYYSDSSRLNITNRVFLEFKP